MRESSPKFDHDGTHQDKVESNGMSPTNKDPFLTMEELRDFLYAKIIDPQASPELKIILDPFEIATASVERLRELQNKLDQLNHKSSDGF